MGHPFPIGQIECDVYTMGRGAGKIDYRNQETNCRVFSTLGKLREYGVKNRSFSNDVDWHSLCFSISQYQAKVVDNPFLAGTTYPWVSTIPATNLAGEI